MRRRVSFGTVVLKVWVAKGQKLDRAKVIQNCQNDFLQDKNLQDKTIFSTASLGEFWTSVKKEKPIIGNEALIFCFHFRPRICASKDLRH